MAVRHDKAEILEKAKVLISQGGLSQRQAARELGVSQSALNAWLRWGKPFEKPTVNRDWNQPKLKPDSKPPKTVTIGNCVNCGRPVVVAKFIAERATWPIEHCTRECRSGAVDVEEMEAVI